MDHGDRRERSLSKPQLWWSRTIPLQMGLTLPNPSAKNAVPTNSIPRLCASPDKRALSIFRRPCWRFVSPGHGRCSQFGNKRAAAEVGSGRQVLIMSHERTRLNFAHMISRSDVKLRSRRPIPGPSVSRQAAAVEDSYSPTEKSHFGPGWAAGTRWRPQERSALDMQGSVSQLASPTQAQRSSPTTSTASFWSISTMHCRQRWSRSEALATVQGCPWS